MPGRKGSNPEDAIVLDDEDSAEQDFLDISNYQPPAKATPIPTVVHKVRVPCDDDVLIYGEELKKSVQSPTEPVASQDKDQKTTQILVSPTQKSNEASMCNKNHRVYEDDYAPQPSRAPTARIYTPSAGRAPVSRANVGGSSPKIQPKIDQKPGQSPPKSAQNVPISNQKLNHIALVAPELAKKGPQNSHSSGKAPNVKKSGTLAERLRLPKLPVITNDHGQSMGFVALPSARNDPRYASSPAVKEAEIVESDIAASTTMETPNKVAPVSPKAVLASAPATNAPRKPRPKKPLTEKPDPPQPIFDILKPNRKRPLSYIAIHELYTPGQVISESGFETKKRQRLEKKQVRALEDGSGPNERQNGQDVGSVEEVIGMGNEPEELPDIIEFDEYDVPESMGTGQVELQDVVDYEPSEMPGLRGIGLSKLPETMGLVPREMPESAGTGSVEMSANANNRAMNQNRSKVTKQTFTVEVGLKPNELDSPQINTEQETAQVEGPECIIQQSPESNQPAIKGQKKVRVEGPAPKTRIPTPKRQATLDFQNHTKQPVSAEDSSTGLRLPIPTTRPTTGGKGISEATLAAWRAAEDRSITHTSPYYSTGQQGDDHVTVMEPIYEYRVHRREWLTEDPEGEANAGEQTLGPYYTFQEANTVAAREIRHPIQLGALHGIPSSAWDYSFRQDYDGLQTQCAEAVGVHIEAEVRRELATPDERPSFPASAFKVSPRVYLVQELSWSPTTTLTTTPTSTPSAPAPPLCETVIHACRTTLDSANNKAAEQWLAAYTGAWSDFHAEGKRKDEVERALKFDLREMKEGKERFHREVAFKDGAMCKIWVVECEVQGPRN